jgi:hypothetical protein
MNSIPRPLFSSTLCVLLLLCGSCHYQADLEIQSNGSGHGSVTIYDPPVGVTKEDVSRQLGINGFHVIAVSAPSAETVMAEVSWQDFEKPFRRRIVNADHSITLDFGPIDQGQLLVHVPGRIDAADTTGTVIDVSSARFKPGRARLTYAPSMHGSLILVSVVAVLLLATVIITVAVSRKRSP